MNKRKLLIIIGSILCLILLILLIQFIRIKTAKIEVNLISDLTAKFDSEIRVSNYIKSINGQLVNDYKIDTTKLGEQEIKFYFVNEDNIKVSYEFSINVVDEVKPLIWLNSKYSVKKDSDINLLDLIMCGDNYDNNPKKEIIGDYDLSVAGTYPLIYKATDNSGNIATKEFTLNVYEPIVNTTTQNNTNTSSVEPTYTYFEDIKNKYKADNTKIGIDVSKWQGDIDFKKIKNAGVEFVIIRLGTSAGEDGKCLLDETFKENMQKAKEVNMPVGVYFYSYASSSKQAKKEAKWVLKQIKKYDIKYPIAYDWEEWKNFNDYNLSFFSLTSMAEDFMKVIEDNGYDTMLYSSKTYLENIWMKTDYDVWLAHYTNKTNYERMYKMWQICDNGNVDGINTLVDINIWFED